MNQQELDSRLEKFSYIEVLLLNLSHKHYSPFMKTEKKSGLSVKTFLFIIPLLGYWIFYDMQHKKKGEYLKSLSLQLTGIVKYVDVPNNSNGFGIVGVDVLQTNKPFVYTTALAKYCVVKDDQAEFYQLGAENCNIGDTIEVDTNKRTFTIKSNGETKVEDVIVYENEYFWKYVRKHTKLITAANTSQTQD